MTRTQPAGTVPAGPDSSSAIEPPPLLGDPASEPAPGAAGEAPSALADIGLVRALDDHVDAWFASVRGNHNADRVFYAASALGDFGLVWVMLALVRALRGRPNDERAALRAVAATGIESVLVNAGLKSLFRRRRPVAPMEHPYPFRQPLTSSFPSGHATAAFCAATLLSDGDDQLAPLYYAAATVVAASRIHVRIHHASDVLAGVAVGLVLGKIGQVLSPLPNPPLKGLRR